MKLKTNIAKLLATGLLLNNIYFYSSANTLDDEIPGRYETLEGEYITIDDSMEGNLEEIEIFGNTVQDESNLNDIQSVGDLYVDKNGIPILDSQGREQYKIDISSTNSVEIPWDKSTIKRDYVINFGGLSDVQYTGYFITDFLEIESNTKYAINSNGEPYTRFAFYDKDKQYISTIDVWGYAPRTSPANAKYMRVGVNDSLLDTLVIQAYVDEFNPNIVPATQHKTTILLPCQLQKVGDMMDRLYWDDTKNRYMIDKVVLKDIKEDVLKVSKLVENDTHIVYRVMLPRAKYPTENTLFSLKKIDYNCDNLGETGYGTFYTDSTFYIKLSVPKDENIVDFINSNSFIYANGDTEIVKTNITSKFKIPTYEGKTYVFAETENSINPTLKVTVDRLDKIAKNAVEEAENNSTSNNISLARMYVNMLPESLYKDQLQKQLSEVFSSDITLDRNTVTSNLDIYVKSENMLSLSLNTNSVTFEGYSGVEDAEMLGAVSISINSSLPYQLNAYLPVEIANSDKSETLPIDILNIRESSETYYKQFANTTDKIILKDGCVKGNNNSHNIDLKLSSNQAHKADIYKTVIKFEAEQK